jgi:putative spermidine/putrescine transport system ATP-binding protein
MHEEETAVSGLVLSGVSKDLGGRTIVDQLDLTVGAGELVCLLGPSGCGKTTTLRMIGGFMRPDAGDIQIAGKLHTTTPPERRPTAMVFQSYALWPHMTVFGNIAFGLKVRKVRKAEISSRVDKVLELVGLSHHRDSYPARISGGEQQRVALARALVLEPEVLLLDEPLSNLDAKLRVKVRDEIREIQRRVGITTVFVTHDQDEALSISDRIAVMNGGRIEQYADARTLYRQPATRFVAEFIGSMNFLPGTVRPDGALDIVGAGLMPCQEVSNAPSGACVLAVRPEDLRISAETEPESVGALATVERELPRGHFTELVLRLGDRELRAFGPDVPDTVGSRVRVSAMRALCYEDDRLHVSQSPELSEVAS